MLSDANAPVRFRAQQQAKYSSLQLTVNFIVAKRCLRHYFKLTLESPTTQDTNFHRHQRSYLSKLESNSPPGWPQPQVFRAYFFNSCDIQGKVQAFWLIGLLWWQNLTWLSSIFFKICKFRSSILLSLKVFIPREETLELSLTVAWFWTNHSSLLRIATTEIASWVIFWKRNGFIFLLLARLCFS